MANYVKLFSKLCYHQISPRYCCIRLGYCDLITPLSATILAITPHNSFQLRSKYWNSSSLICAPNIEKNIRTMGFACLLRPKRAGFWYILSLTEVRHRRSGATKNIVIHWFSIIYVVNNSELSQITVSQFFLKGIPFPLFISIYII